MKVKTKVTIDGQEREIEVDLDDNQYLTREQHEIRVRETVRSRLARQAANIRKELLGDEEFVGEVLKAKGVDPAAKGKGDKALTDSDVARLQEEWRTRELQPVQEKLAQVEKEMADDRQTTLVASLTTALVGAGVEKGIAPRIAAMEAARFGYDEKTKAFAVRNGDGFAFSSKATDDKPYKGLDEFATDWAADKANAPFVTRMTQQGANLGNTTGGAAPSSVRSLKDIKTDDQRVAYIRENGLAKFQALPPE